MFALSSFESAAHILIDEKNDLGIGLWSVLLTRSAEDDRRFFELYYDFMNKHTSSTWHCIGFARGAEKSNKTVCWRADARQHQCSREIRRYFIESGTKLPDMCLAFFNPRSTAATPRCVVVPLDADSLENEAKFQMGISLVTKAVRHSVAHIGKSGSRLTENDVDNVLNVLEPTLKTQGLGQIFASISTRFSGPAFGALFANALRSILG